MAIRRLAAEELENMSAITGVAAADLESLQRIAEDAGVGGVNLASAIGQLNRQLASGEGGDFAKTLGMLGGSIRDESGATKDAITVLDEMAERLRGIEDPTLRAQMANSDFGRQLRELIPLLLNSNSSLRDMIDTMKSSGRVMSEDTRQAFKDLDDTLDTINGLWQEIKNSILSATGALLGFIRESKNLPLTPEQIQKIETGISQKEMAASKGKVQFPKSPFVSVQGPKTPQELQEEAEAKARATITGLQGRGTQDHDREGGRRETSPEGDRRRTEGGNAIPFGEDRRIFSTTRQDQRTRIRTEEDTPGSG